MRYSVALFLAFFLTLFGAIGIAKADVAVPPLRALATDLTETLSRDELSALDLRLKNYEAQTGSQIAVLIVPTTQPEEIEQYSLRVVEQWKIGRQKIDDGVLFLIAKNDRKMRIEVGYGLEGALPDITAKRIISDIVAPYFKSGDFVGGINVGVDAILAAIGGENLPAPATRSAGGNQNPLGGAMIVGVLGVYALLRLTRLGIRECILTVSILTGIVALFVTTLLYAFLSIFAAALACLVFELRIFSGFGGGFGGGSGGGWSGGGGGGFGGGGASGGW